MSVEMKRCTNVMIKKQGGEECPIGLARGAHSFVDNFDKSANFNFIFFPH